MPISSNSNEHQNFWDDSSTSFGKALRAWDEHFRKKSPTPTIHEIIHGTRQATVQPTVEEACSHEVEVLPTSFGVAKMEDKWIKRGLEMLPPEKKAIFLEKWKAMEIHEAELFVERSGLIHELANMILEVRKK